MFDILGIDHIVFRARDLGRLTAFYRDLLGCTVEKVQDEYGLVQLRAGSALIDLVDVAGPIGRGGGAPPGPTGHNTDHLCLRIEPWRPEAIIAHLRSHGVQIDDAPSERYGADGYGPSLYLSDPEGNRLELKGPPSRPPEGAET